MANILDERKRVLVKISTMYYIEGYSQQEITDRLGISRSQISRMLAEARDAGIVQITVHDPFSDETKYEKILSQAFGLKEVVIVDASQSVSVNIPIGNAAAGLLERLIKDNCAIGINAGNSLSYISSAARHSDKKNLRVVPLVGGWGPSGAKWQANLSSRVLAENLGCKYLQLNAPAFVSNKEIRDALLGENEISYVLSEAQKISIALVGIGQISPDSTLMKTGFLTEENICELKEKGAVANICNSFIAEDGSHIQFSAYENMIGLTIEDVKHVPCIIGVASGRDKIDAIHASLKGKYLDYLVTDLETARLIAEKYLEAQNDL